MEQKALNFRSVLSQDASVLLDTSVLIYYTISNRKRHIFVAQTASLCHPSRHS